MKRIVGIVVVGLCSTSLVLARGGDAFAGGLAGGMFGGVLGSAMTKSSEGGSSGGNSSMYSELEKLRYDFGHRLEQLNHEIRELKENSGGGISPALLRRVARLEELVKDNANNDVAQDPLLHSDVESLKRDVASNKRMFIDRISDLELRVKELAGDGYTMPKKSSKDYKKPENKFEKEEISSSQEEPVYNVSTTVAAQ